MATARTLHSIINTACQLISAIPKMLNVIFEERIRCLYVLDFVPIDKGVNHIKITLNWHCLTFSIAIPKIISKYKRRNVFIPKTSQAAIFDFAILVKGSSVTSIQ